MKIPILVVCFIITFSANLMTQDKYWIEPSELPAVEQAYIDSITPQPIDTTMGHVYTTGSVILYGQILEPPYQLLILNDTLYLNGIRVNPLIKPPWRYLTEPFEITESIEEQVAWDSRIEAKYFELFAEDSTTVQDRLLQYLAENEPSVDTALWCEFAGSPGLWLEFKNGGSYGMSLPPIPEPSASELELVRIGHMNNQAGQIGGCLSSGSLAIIGYNVSVYITHRKKDAFMQEIMENLEIYSMEGLSDVLGGFELAKEMLFWKERMLNKGE